jgi:hypothetical protein
MSVLKTRSTRGKSLHLFIPYFKEKNQYSNALPELTAHSSFDKEHNSPQES